MKVPDKFPEDCEFRSSFGGDEFVRFPDGSWFRLDEDKVELAAMRGEPVSKCHSSSEASFLNWVSEARKVSAANAAS